MIRMWRVLEPIPIRDAAPMSAAGFASVAIEAAILNYVIGTNRNLNIRATWTAYV
jgi:hypothetical protein